MGESIICVGPIDHGGFLPTGSRSLSRDFVKKKMRNLLTSEWACYWNWRKFLIIASGISRIFLLGKCIACSTVYLLSVSQASLVSRCIHHRQRPFCVCIAARRVYRESVWWLILLNRRGRWYSRCVSPLSQWISLCHRLHTVVYSLYVVH